MESVIFLALLVIEQVRQHGWLHFLIPAGCWREEFSCGSVEWTSRSRRLALCL